MIAEALQQHRIYDRNRDSEMDLMEFTRFMDSLVDRDCVKEILESVPLVSCILCCQTDLIHDGMPLMALFYVAGARDIVPRAGPRVFRRPHNVSVNMLHVFSVWLVISSPHVQ